MKDNVGFDHDITVAPGPVRPRLELLNLGKILLPSGTALLPGKITREQETQDPTVASLAARVARHPFFAGMKREQLRSVADCATAVEFKKGHVIFREDELADRFYVIEHGNVVLESSAGPGDPMLGWSWMFPPHRWTFTARVLEPTTAIFLDVTLLREYCERDHSFGYELLKRMSLVMYQRLRSARTRLLTIRSGSAPHPRGRAKGS